MAFFKKKRCRHDSCSLPLSLLSGPIVQGIFTHRTRWPSPPFNLLAEVIFECQDTDVYQLDPMLPDRLFCSNQEWIGQHPKCVTINRQQQPHFALTGNDRVSLMAPSLSDSFLIPFSSLPGFLSYFLFCWFYSLAFRLFRFLGDRRPTPRPGSVFFFFFSCCCCVFWPAAPHPFGIG